MKSTWGISDWWWWLVDAIGGRTALCLERWYWRAYAKCDWWHNHLSWTVRCWQMRYWSWYYRTMPDSVTLALGALFTFCAIFAILTVGLAWFGIWALIC